MSYPQTIESVEREKPDEVVQTPEVEVLASHIAVLPELEPSESVDALLKQYNWNVDIAHKVILAESGGYERANNPEWHKDRDGNYICQSSRGLFQIGCVNYSGDLDDLYIPSINIDIAYRIYTTQGKGAWGVCKNGKVDCTDW